jgi:hypothetical protein
MEMEYITTILISLITVFGSTSAWKFYEKNTALKRKEENLIQSDWRDRIAKLEVLLENASKEKDIMRETILELTRQVSQLSVKVEFFERENRRLYDINMQK